MLFNIVKYWLESGLALEKGIKTPSYELAHLLDVVFNDQNKPKDYNPKHIYSHINVVLLSGGLDSTVLWYATRSPKIGYYINIGQSYAEKEKASLIKNGIRFKELSFNIKGMGNGDWYYTIPARNLLFATLVAELHHLDNASILMASNDGEMPVEGGDKSYQFLSLINALMKPLGKEIVTPFANITKTEEVQKGIKLGIKDKLYNTISCLEGEDGRCGRCQSCFRTWVAFTNNGMELDFNNDVIESGTKHIEKYQRNMTDAVNRNDYSHYSKKRIQEMEMALAIVGVNLIQK